MVQVPEGHLRQSPENKSEFRTLPLARGRFAPFFEGEVYRLVATEQLRGTCVGQRSVALSGMAQDLTCTPKPILNLHHSI